MPLRKAVPAVQFIRQQVRKSYRGPAEKWEIGILYESGSDNNPLTVI